MTPVITIEDSTISHARELSMSLREKDQQEARALGADPTKALYFSFRQALYRKTGFVDGKVAAMWGLVGTPFGVIGQPYLVTGKEIEKISPLTFARLYKKEVETMKRFFPVLENYVDATYEGAVKMLELAGFTLSESKEAWNGVFRKFSLVTE